MWRGRGRNARWTAACARNWDGGYGGDETHDYHNFIQCKLFTYRFDFLAALEGSFRPIPTPRSFAKITFVVLRRALLGRFQEALSESENLKPLEKPSWDRFRITGAEVLAAGSGSRELEK